jgi:hypothetical protein
MLFAFLARVWFCNSSRPQTHNLLTSAFGVLGLQDCDTMHSSCLPSLGTVCQRTQISLWIYLILQNTCMVIFLLYDNVFWNPDSSMVSIRISLILFTFSTYCLPIFLDYIFKMRHSRKDFIHWKIVIELKWGKVSFLILCFIISIDMNNENLPNPESTLYVVFYFKSLVASFNSDFSRTEYMTCKGIKPHSKQSWVDKEQIQILFWKLLFPHYGNHLTVLRTSPYALSECFFSLFQLG